MDWAPLLDDIRREGKGLRSAPVSFFVVLVLGLAAGAFSASWVSQGEMAALQVRLDAAKERETALMITVGRLQERIEELSG